MWVLGARFRFSFVFLLGPVVVVVLGWVVGSVTAVVTVISGSDSSVAMLSWVGARSVEVFDWDVHHGWVALRQNFRDREASKDDISSSHLTRTQSTIHI